MSELEVRIVKLEPLRVASVHAYGASPEGKAWDKLVAWAKPKGLLDRPGEQRIFGFNNPDPAPGSPNYGYEFWIVVGPEVQPEGEVKIKEFAGGLYAVARCQVRADAGQVIGETWQRLMRWCENSQYRLAHHQWLEEHQETTGMPNEFALDLHLPITK